MRNWVFLFALLAVPLFAAGPATAQVPATSDLVAALRQRVEGLTGEIKSGKFERGDLANVYFRRAGAFAGLRRFDYAVSDFTFALRLKPGFTEAYYRRGNVFSLMGRHDLAIDDFTTALGLRPGTGKIHVDRANSYRAKGQYEFAIADYDKALEINPGNAGALTDRGLTHLLAGDLDQSIADQNRALEMQPEFSVAYFNRAKAYALDRQYQRAISDFTQAVRYAPAFSEAYFRRGLAQEQLGAAAAAAADYSKAIDINPTAWPLYRARAQVQFQLGDFAAAAADARWLLDHGMAEPFTLLWAFILAERAGEDGAAAIVSHLGAAGDKWPGPLIGLMLDQITPADALAAAGATEEPARARRLCDGHFFIAEYHLINGRPEKAAASFRKAVAACATDATEGRSAAAELARLAPAKELIPENPSP